MNKSLQDYIKQSIDERVTESKVGKMSIMESATGKKLTDYDQIQYPDGTVIDTAEMQEKVRLCLYYIFSNFSYFTPALKALTVIYADSIDTMATDGIRLFINPRFLMKLTDEQCIFVLLHECMHNILSHLMRTQQNGFTNPERANIAADYEVNGILEDDGLVKKGTTKSIHGLIDPKYSGWSFERIYADPNLNASVNKPQQQQSSQGGQGGQGQQQDKGPDYKAGWNQAMKDYRERKLKL